MVAAGGTLALAVAAWAILAWQSSMAMSSMAMPSMAPASPWSFGSAWIVMTAAMMLPSATPFVVAFTRGFARDRLWLVGAALLVAAYLAVWAVFGLVLFAVSRVVLLPAPSVAVTLIAVAFAAAYGLSPLRRAGEARCVDMCRRFEGAAGGAVRSAVARGGRYGLGCVLCTAGVMVAVFVVGMSDLRLMAVGTAAVALLKLRSWAAMA